MKFYNCASRSDPKDRLIDYSAFVEGLRQPLTGRRLLIVEEVWAKFTGDKDAESTTLGQLRPHFTHPNFEHVADALDVEDKDEVEVTRKRFMDLQADFSMTVFDEDKYIGLVSTAWDV